MKANLKSIAVLAILAALGSGCASVSVEGDGNNASGERPDYIVSQLEDGSRGK